MPFFVDPLWEKLLEFNRLNSFDQVWNCQAEWIDAPNDTRGGMSGVSRLVLALPDSDKADVFLKRQQNHRRRTWRHPYHGEPTFVREYRVIRYLQQHGVAVPPVVLFAERRYNGNLQAALMTRELGGYRSFEEAGNQVSALSLSAQRVLLRAVAKAVRSMHLAGIQHRSLYAKHLFVKPRDDDYDAALIDFEKSRRNPLPLLRTYSDLVTLNYRTGKWSRSSRLYFFKQYYGVDKLKPWQKWLCRLIHRRSTEKRGKAAANKR